MFLPIPKSTYCELDDASIITPYRRPNHLRNQSLPNFRFHSRGPKTQPFQHLKYNKWYIKPEKRLKDSLVHNSCD